ncbi:MAG: SIMPL domain-containing protein [Flavobacterium sp.]
MKKIALVLFVIASAVANAQVTEKMPAQINVTGEGKVKVMPDQAIITVGVENVGNNAAEVKKKNDTAIDAVIKFLKSSGLPATDYQTRRVNLGRNYDYDKKKYNFTASQTIVITLKDLAKYDSLMMGLTDAGVNTINGVEFRTSKQAQYETEARTKAVQAARGKAGDYAAALGQKAGKALMVTDNTQTYYPVANMARYDMAMEKMDSPRETLAVGEIEITANVNISFQLD